MSNSNNHNRVNQIPGTTIQIPRNDLKPRRNESNDKTEFRSSIFDDVTPFEILMREEYSDVNLVIGTNIIAVHQIILASHSNFLDNILNDHNKLKEYGINENIKFQERFHLLDKTSIVLSEFSLQAVTKMVHFLYSGELISDTNGLDELKTLASTLQMTFLETQVLELESRLSVIDEANPHDSTVTNVDLENGVNFNFGTLNDLSIESNSDNNIILDESMGQDSDVLNNASFITLSGLENLGLFYI